MRGRAVWIALLLLVPGCLTGSDRGPGAASPDDGDHAAPPPSASLPTYLLDGRMRLTQQAPTQAEPARVHVGSFYANWTTGGEQPTWTGPPTASAMRIDHVQLTFFYTADQGGVVTTGPQDQGFPEFVVYLGTEQAPMATASLEGPDLVREGETVRVSGSLSVPTGGLVLPAGVEPVVKIAPVQGQTDQADEIVILVNGTQAPSRATLQGERITLPQSTSEPVLDEQGTLAGSAYATGPQEGTTAANHTVEIPPGAAGLRASLERVQGAGIADIDLQVLGPDGAIVAQSVTPEDDEGIALYQPNIDAVGPGTWTLRVVNYGNAVVDYELSAELLAPVTSA